MAAPEIQISKDGLKISYQQYLSDSSTGFLLILIMLFLISKGYPLPFIGNSLESILRLQGNIQLFFIVISFLLAIPFGLVVNAFSFFLIGWCELGLVSFLFDMPEKWYNPLLSTKKIFRYNELCVFFNINKQNGEVGKNVYSLSQIYKEYLGLFFQDRIRMEFGISLRYFVRSLSCISLFLFLSTLHVMFWSENVCFSFSILFFLLILAILFLLLYSILAGYSCLKGLSSIYLLCIVHDISSENTKTPEELIKKIHAAYFGEKSGGEN